ncbi:MAG: hypothetical protein IRY99_14680, partial [Isosphaeraceae bacterium]|nr:hypothetical protein [Isosphaeraceae bacterium]
GFAALGGPWARAAWGGIIHRVDPAQVVPIDQIAPQYRETVAEVIRDNTFHCKGKADTFPCNPRLYLSLLNEPAVTLALWKDLSPTPARLQQVGPGRYVGTDGVGTTATWEFVYRSPQMHVLLSDLEHVTPRGNARLNGRIVLVVRSHFFRESAGDFWVRHDVEAFVKVDSKGWKAVATTVRPVLERILDDQIHEAGLFVSLMGRLVETYPTWAQQVVANQAELSPEIRRNFHNLVAQIRRPGASNGRPQVLAENTEATATRMR